MSTFRVTLLTALVYGAVVLELQKTAIRKLEGAKYNEHFIKYDIRTAFRLYAFKNLIH